MGAIENLIKLTFSGAKNLSELIVKRTQLRTRTLGRQV